MLFSSFGDVTKNWEKPQGSGEMLKCGPEILFAEIAEIFNLISETGIYPTEIKKVF